MINVGQLNSKNSPHLQAYSYLYLMTYFWLVLLSSYHHKLPVAFFPIINPDKYNIMKYLQSLPLIEIMTFRANKSEKG